MSLLIPLPITDLSAFLAQKQQFSDKMRLIFLELPYFTKEENECKTNFERWLYVLNNMETLDRMPFLAQKAAFEKLIEVVKFPSFICCSQSD